MNNIVYGIISDPEFGIKINDDIKNTIVYYLDKNKSKVQTVIDEVVVENDKIVNAHLTFKNFKDLMFFGYYKITPELKSFRISIFGNDANITEDYKIIANSNGLTEYEINVENGQNSNRIVYYYNNQEITEEEARKINNQKTM